MKRGEDWGHECKVAERPAARGGREEAMEAKVARAPGIRLHHLPEDLIVYVFQFLGGGECGRLNAVELAHADQVCKGWRRAHGWRRLSLTELAAQRTCLATRGLPPPPLIRSPPIGENGLRVVQANTNGVWKHLMHTIRICSADCWCNYCFCEAKRDEPGAEPEEPSVSSTTTTAGEDHNSIWMQAFDSESEPRLERKEDPDPAAKSNGWVVARSSPSPPPPRSNSLCLDCGGFDRRPCPKPRLAESHTTCILIPWEVFEKQSRLTTLFSYKDGWEKKPLWLSAPFWLDQLEWRLMCFPKGVPSGPSGCISLFLECATLCRCMCHTQEGGEHHFHTGVPHPEHSNPDDPPPPFEAIMASFSLTVLRPVEMRSEARLLSTTKEAKHEYRFGVPVDSGWRNMVSNLELQRCRCGTGEEEGVQVDVRVAVTKRVKNKKNKRCHELA